MPKPEPILTVQNHQEQSVQFASAKKIELISNRAIPYIALAVGLYENQTNPIQFAIDHLDQINNLNPASEPITSISKVYKTLEVYADRLGAQQIITLPQLARLYGTAKKLSDDKTAKAVLTSLAARHLAFKADISHCQQTHIDDAKNIIAATGTYFRQEAEIDAMVFMVSSLCKEPDNYQTAATQGNRAELKKLSGAKVFSTQNQDKVNRIRLLLIAAQSIANQVEEKQLDDAYIVFTIKQELLKQGVDEKLANAITIVASACYFFENNESIPSHLHLEQAAEWLAKSEAIINYKANQASTIKFLQEYLKVDGTAEKAISAAEQLKQEVFSGNSIEGQLKSKGRIAELSWTAVTLVKDYTASYYFSPIDGAFKINRNNTQSGNGLYSAALNSLQNALKDDLNNSIHKLTAEILSKNIRELLPASRGIIVEQFNNIIRNNANLLSVPTAFAEELNLLKSSWQQRANLSIESQKILDQDINNYLETISTRYIAFANNNQWIGSDIELKIIAHYYNVQIKQHSHFSDDHTVINPDAELTAHILCALYQGHYHSLVEQKDLKLKDEQLSSSAYIEQAVCAASNDDVINHLESVIVVLALHNPVVWQFNKPYDLELLKQSINTASKKIHETLINGLTAHHDQLLNQSIQSQLNNLEIKQEVKVQELENHDLTLSLELKEQLSIIDKEAALSTADIELAATTQQLRNNKTGLLKIDSMVAIQKLQTATENYNNANLALSNVRQILTSNQYHRKLLEDGHTLLIEELDALGVANLQAYTAWWQNVIKEQRNAIEIAFATVNSQIDRHIVGLTKAYEQQLTAVDNHYADVLSKNIKAYYDHQRCVAEAERTAKRKRRQKMYRSCAGMLVAAFVAPVLAQSMFAPGFGCAVATGAIAGGISSGIAGNNVFKGAALGGIFAGFGFGVDQALGKFIESSELLRGSLSVAATASLSTAIYGGKLLDNILVSVGANAAASLIVPIPKFAANKDLTKIQLNAINNRQVMRAFTRGITTSLISKDSNLGMSLITAGMGGLQSWVGHQANLLAEQRRAIQQQQAEISRPAITAPHARPRGFNTTRNTVGTGRLNQGPVSRDRTSRCWVNLPENEHPVASAFRRRILVNEQPTDLSKQQSVEDRYLIINKYDLINSQAIEQRPKSLAEKALDFFIPAAYAEELPEVAVALPLDKVPDCELNKIETAKNAIINGVVGGIKGAGIGWLGVANGVGSATITSVLDDGDAIKACKKQKLKENSEGNPKVDKAINKTINKAIGAAATGLDVASMINKATNKAITHVMTAATSSLAESIIGGYRSDNPDCNLRKSLIFSNIAGGAVGTAAGSALLSAVTVNPIPTSTAMLFGASGGAIQGYVEAKKEQNICIAKKEKEKNATTHSACSPKKP